MKENKGITLVALVVTIVILLILAGVTLNITLSNDGIFNKAKKATKEYQIASEREYIEQNVLLYQMNNATDNAEKTKLGMQLFNRTSINDNQWTVIQLLDNTKEIYGNNYNYLKKGTDLKDYGHTNYNWVINYETGEVIDIGEDKKDYVMMSWKSGISVTDNIVLNINPINMSNQDEWGENVTFCNENGSINDVSGFNKTEIKFDGVDDYLKLENVDIEESDGFTFEFYGKGYTSSIFFLNKSILDENDKTYSNNFRTTLHEKQFSCCFSNRDSESELRADNENNKHWIEFHNIKKSNDYNYISMTVNFNTGEVKVYNKGSLAQSTTCNKDYLKSESIKDSSIPFTIGLQVGGDPNNGGKRKCSYSKFDLYSCRLYTRVLSDQEIENNFNETISYHNYLIK